MARQMCRSYQQQKARFPPHVDSEPVELLADHVLMHAADLRDTFYLYFYKLNQVYVLAIKTACERFFLRKALHPLNRALRVTQQPQLPLSFSSPLDQQGSLTVTLWNGVRNASATLVTGFSREFFGVYLFRAALTCIFAVKQLM